MKLVDQFGKPFDPVALTDSQTSRLVHLQNHIAGHPSRGITPARLNQILESAEQGNLIAQHELFRDMEERDGHLFSELSKRKRSVIKLNWDVVPPRNASKEEAKNAEYVKELLLDFQDFEDLMFDALDGVAHGFSALEYEWGRVGSDWLVQCAHHRPQSWFQTDLTTRSKLRLRDNGPDGQELQPFGWMMHVHKAASGYVTRSGLGRVLVWPYLFKHFSVGDLAEFLDIYGLPLRVGKFPSNATPEEKATLWRAVAGIGHNAAGIIPASMQVEFEQAASGTEKPFEAMIHWCESTQSKAVCGYSTSDAKSTGLGSGIADYFKEVREDIRDGDCKQLAGTLTRDLIYPLLSVNKGVADPRRCPRLVFDVLEAEDLKTFSDSLPKLVGVGMKIPVQWAHEKLRIPLPAEGEEVLEMEAPEAPEPEEPDEAPETEGKPGKGKDSKAGATAAAKVALSATSTAVVPATGGQYADQLAIDGAVGGSDAALQALAEKWLEPSIAALAQAGSYEAALELLASANPQVADSVLVESLARAMFVVELVGAHSAAQDLSD